MDRGLGRAERARVGLGGNAVDGLRDDPMPHGVDTIRLRISFPAAPAPQGYDDRIWRMRPLRGWTGGQADGGAAIPIADHVPTASIGIGVAAPNTAPPPLDPNRPFVVDRRYDDALRRVRETPPHFGRADAPVPAMPEGDYQPGLGFLMLRIASARPEDLPQLYADIRVLYMQPGAHRTGEALIRAAGDAAEAGGNLRARREILSGIAPIAKSDPLQLAADEFSQPGAVLGGVGAGMVGRRGDNLVGASARNQPGRPSVPNVLGSEVKNIGTQVQGRFPTTPQTPNAVMYRADSNGTVTSHQVWAADGFPAYRVEMMGASHGGIPTPHVTEFGRNVSPSGQVFVGNPSLPRPATPKEVP